MALYNEILTGRFNRFLQKFLGLKGGPPSPQLATEVSTELLLDDAFRLENRWTAQIRSFANGTLAPAVAAAFTFFRIINPLGSGVICTIEKAWVSSLTAAAQDQLLLTRGPVGAAGAVTGSFRDLRISGGSAAQVISGSAAASTGATIWIAQLSSHTLADVILFENQEIVLMPNDVLTFWGGTVNVAITAGFFWRERVLEESELA